MDERRAQPIQPDVTRPDTPDLLAFHDVRFCYAEVCAVGDVSLGIQPATLTVLVGPNGGGKSTLMRLMTGQLKPESGQIDRYGTVAYVPQTPSFDSSFPLTVGDFVIMGTLDKRIRPFYRYSRKDHQKASDALEWLGLSGLAARGISQLSGGQLRRAMIARALAADTSIIALDEPDANLDIDANRDLYQVLGRLKKEKTIILASHHLDEVLPIADVALYVNKTVTTYPDPRALLELLKDGLIR
ncbi:MAG: ATP-binding cassette domain-containing protein [Clostridia bacterium]|nr:ATP-binding cassette domain-containing protein [Clostridia bacterium]NCC75571.1 ATP-binding cassette domain-containing protein [Clostridia bacterium]